MGRWRKWSTWRSMLFIVHGNRSTKHTLYLIFDWYWLIFSPDFFYSHHNIVANKTKSTKHASMPMLDKFSVPLKAEESRKQIDVVVKKSMKHYQLPNVPLYHAAHGQLIHRLSDTVDDSIRNRSSIQKRASKADWLSRNISMVLEQLLRNYENSYLPTHGQGA